MLSLCSSMHNKSLPYLAQFHPFLSLLSDSKTMISTNIGRLQLDKFSSYSYVQFSSLPYFGTILFISMCTNVNVPKLVERCVPMLGDFLKYQNW